jgi:hypothetical protein
MRPSERTGARGLDMGVPLRRRPSRRGLPFREAGVVALAALAVLAVWWSWPSRTSSRDTPRQTNSPEPAASPAVVQVAPPPSDAPAVTASVGEAAPAPASVPSPEAEAPTPSAAAFPAPEPGASPAAEAPALSADAAPTPAPTSAPAESAAGSTPSPATDLAAAVERTTAARRDADEARAREFAPTTYARAVAKQASAQGLAARKSTAQAAAAYRDAAALFARAAEAARQTHPSAPRAPRSRAAVEPAPGPPPELLPADSRAAEPAPGSAPSEKAAPEPAAAEPQQETVRAEEPAAAEASAEAHRQIVQAIGDYAWARRHHDPQLLARVFPSDGARLAQEPSDLTAAGLTVEVQAIDFETETRASATVQERLTPAEPWTGGAPEWTTVVLDLEKRGRRWVIVSRRRL